MSTETRSRGSRVAGLVAGIVIISTLYLLITPLNASLANGVLGGGLVALAGAAIAFWRGGRPSATSVERGMSGHADERDSAVARSAFALTGAAAFLWTGGAVIALGVGAPVPATSAIMIWGLLLTLVAAWVYYSRRL